MTPSDASALAQGNSIEDAAQRESDAGRGIFSRGALEALYRRHAVTLLRRLAGRIDREEARDLVQEAFVRLAAMAPDRRASIDCPEAFVTTVATNALRDRARASARQAAERQRQGNLDPTLVSDPHSLMESREALGAIEQALAQMNPRRRRIFMLHRFEHLTYAQVGTEVGMSEKGIKKQIAKALAELRQAVDHAA